ncbi:hypothetical protein MYX82_02560 [Acidobacteria bacterium AH-259-D05]|nr:hypothetical protein [Acidobacteria bacterium AH-259-D05]
MIRNGLVAASLLLGMSMLLSAQEELAQGDVTPEDVEIKTSVSQTSVWPGDRIHYIITLTVAQGVKVALDDFSEQNVTFEPFILVEKRQTEEDVGEEHRLEFDYLIANYEIGDKQVEIPGLIFRYEKSGPEQTNVPTMEEKQIPPQPMSIRSTLNQPVEESWIRESLPMTEVSRNSWIVVLAGFAGLLVSSLPLGAWAWKQIPDWQARRRQLSRKKFLSQCRGSLDQLEWRLTGDNAQIKEHYQSLEELVRSYILYFWNIPAQGLIHTELISRLNQSEVSSKESEVFAEIFEHGHNCRYSPDNGTAWEGTFRQDLEQVKGFFAL